MPTKTDQILSRALEDRLERLRERHVRDEPEEVLRDREAVAEGGFLEFVRRAWPIVVPQGFRENWHVGVIAEHLEAVTEGDIRNLIVNVPPGTTKTMLVSVLWPAWWWTMRPSLGLIAASYSARLANRDARRMRAIVHSRWYRDRWPGSAVEDLQRIIEYYNVAGGWRLSTTPGSDATGFHPDVHVCDDPLKPRDARETQASLTRAQLEEVNEWWADTMATRARDLATLRRVIIMQRLHEMDLSGSMSATGEYDHLVLPMEYNPKVQCETSLGSPDPRTEPGELLDPVRFPREAVDSLREQLGPAAAAQLDQAPVPPGGGMFKEEWFGRRWSELPRGLILIQSWDMRFKKDAESGSYVVGQTWGYLPGEADMYLVEQVRGRWSYAESKDEFVAFAARWPRCVTRLVENKANGPALASDLEGRVGGIELVDPLGDKTLRANVAEPHWRAGRVWLPAEDNSEGVDASWVPEFVREHTRFPRYKTDDQVDAASQAIAWMHLEGSQTGDYMAWVEQAAQGR